MKRIALLVLMVMASIAYSQTNTIQIINYTPNPVQFKLKGTGNFVVIDCQPIIESVNYATINSGQSVIFNQYNNSMSTSSPIPLWKVISSAVGGDDYTANIPAGITIPAFVSNLSKWSGIEILSPAGDHYQLYKDCEGSGGVFSTPAGATITAQWNQLAGNALVLITP